MVLVCLTGKRETRDQKNADELKASVIETSLAVPQTGSASAVPQTDHLHATPNWGSN